MKSATMTLVLPTLLVLGGCGSVDSVDNALLVAVDDGTLCMFSDAPLIPGAPAGGSQLLSFEEGSQLFVTVSLDDCLSDSCDVNREASCQVTQEGTTLQINSELSYEMVEATQCTMDCGRLVARCESAPLSGGHYMVEFGDDVFGLSVPSTLVTACR
jgi:hypothetical protein